MLCNIIQLIRIICLITLAAVKQIRKETRACGHAAYVQIGFLEQGVVLAFSFVSAMYNG